MVALTIIITSVSSALALVQSSITATRLGGAQILASNLAREGVEVVRSIRDSNWLASDSFQEGLLDGTAKTGRPELDTANAVWTIDFTDLTLDDERTRLYIETDGRYVHADSPPPAAGRTPYKRLLNIDYVCRNEASGVERIETDATDACAPGETLIALNVRSNVRWQSIGGFDRNMTVEERLYDWR